MPQKSEAELLRDSMTREVSNDAYHIATQIFAQPQPDMARMSNDQVDARYRQAFESNDREYLSKEAVRDPRQFLESMHRLGVSMPPDQSVPAQPPLPRPAQAAAPVPQPPPQTLESAQAVPAEQVPGLIQPPQPALPPAPPVVAPPMMPPAMA